MKRATLVFAFSVLSLISTYAQTEAATAPASTPTAAPASTPGAAPAATAPAAAPAVSASGAIALTGISFEKAEINLGLDAVDFMSRVSLSIKAVPDNATNKDVTWESSDRAIVRVSPKGTLTPMSVGTATITATSDEGGFKAVCTVHVLETGDKPVFDPKIKTELKGWASVSYDYDLDNSKGAFTRDSEVSLILNVINQGENKTTGSTPIWGEIRVYTEGDPLTYGIDDENSDTAMTAEDNFHVVVDYAKIHVGDGYMTVYDKDYSELAVADYASTYNRSFNTRTADTEHRYGQISDDDKIITYADKTSANELTAEESTLYGFQIGYERKDLFGLSFDIASTDQWVESTTDSSLDTASKDATDYAYKLAAKFLYIKNLTVELGYSNGILGEDSTTLPDILFGGKADYRWFFNDKYDLYLMPSAGVTMVRQESIGDLLPMASGSLLLGFDEKADAFDYWGAKFCDDYDYGPFPGVSLGFMYADGLIWEQSDDYVELSASFNTGNGLFVKGLEAVGAYTIFNLLNDEEEYTGLTVGCVYNWKLPSVKITPKFLVTRFDYQDSDDSYMFVKAGLVVEPYSNVSVEVNYQSNDLINGFETAVEYQKSGKIETIFKVSF